MKHDRVRVLFRAALCFVVLEFLISFECAQASCLNPLNIGELRVFKSKECVDIAGLDGAGNVGTYACDGGQDQQMIICDDGTIRNQARNYCLQPDGSGNANVVSSPCSVSSEIPSWQRWRVGRNRRFTDSGGISQVAAEIINMESNRCLDVQGTDGYGNIGVYWCENFEDQYFYVRSRGREVAHGSLQNERSHLCVDVTGYDGEGNVQMYNCEGLPDQYFRFYENGEIINEESRLCVDVKGTDGNGNVMMYACEDFRDQMWESPRSLCSGSYCPFLNKQSGKCLDVKGTDGKGDIGTYHCEGFADQRFKWVADTWNTPSVSWINIGCNKNGNVSRKISNKVSFDQSITPTISNEVSSAIGTGVDFLSAEVSTKISTALALAWTGSRSGTTAIEYTCGNYDNGEEFTRGCMWQLQVETKQDKSGDLLIWNPQIVKCTGSDEAPKCAPFTKCVDEDCNSCDKSI